MRIQIGNATLYLAQCEDVLALIGAVDCLVIDPPYLIKTSGGGAFRKMRNAMEKIKAAGIDKGFDINIIDPRLYKSVVTFCHNDQLHTLLPWAAKNYRRHALCAWEKSNPMPMANKHYKSNLEYYIHMWQRGAHPVGELIDKSRTVKTAVGKSEFDHPTVKPQPVMEKIMRNVNGNTVLDCYMGTGSTGLAALKYGKKFIGIEKDAKFFNIACARLTAYYAGMSAPVSV